MSRLFTANEICAQALRAIGKFPVSESAPDGESLRTAMFWLDLILAYVSGTHELLFQAPETLTFDLVAGQSEYPLANTLSANYPTDGIQFTKGVWLQDAGGNRYDIEIVGRKNWQDKSKPSETGVPCEVYIDRLTSPTLYTYPTLPDDETATYTLYLDVQTFSPDVSPGGVSGTQPSGSIKTEFRPAWQYWLIFKLAIALGIGPVTKVSPQTLKELKEEERVSFAKLEAFENREHDSEPPLTQAWGT